MNEKRYYSLDKFYRKKFGCKVFKVSIDGGFGCPNKDGTKGVGGCTFCNGSTGIGRRREDILSQFENVKKILHKKWPNAKYIPFFEANTNTYATVEKLKETYEPLLEIHGVVGLAIATRCDAFSKDIYDYLEDISHRTYLSIELGLQSSHDEILMSMNRGHTREEFASCVKELRKRNIDVVVHLIDGYPGETYEMMLETIDFINQLDIQGVKFHMLYIEKGTALAKMYEMNPFQLLSRDEYIDILEKQICLLDEKIVVHRILSGPNNRLLVEPKWLLGKFVNLNMIEKRFAEDDVHQGSKL